MLRSADNRNGQVIFHVVIKLAINKLHFVFNDPNLNSLPVTEILVQKIKNKNVILIGNSMEHALFEVLYFMVGHSATALLDQENRNMRKEFDHGHNGTVHLYISVNQMLLSKSLLKHFISTSDIFILNFGLHYEKWSVMEYVTYVESMLEILNASRKTVVLRGTTPQHFPTDGGFYHAKLKMFLSECSDIRNQPSHPTNVILKALAEKFEFGFLDEFLLFSSRWDLHYRKGDCTHLLSYIRIVLPANCTFTPAYVKIFKTIIH